MSSAEISPPGVFQHYRSYRSMISILYIFYVMRLKNCALITCCFFAVSALVHFSSLKTIFRLAIDQAETAALSS